MAKLITRTVQKTLYNVGKVVVNGNDISIQEMLPFEIEGAYNEEKAIKYAKKEYGKKDNYVVMDSKTEEITRAMALEDFIANSYEVK